MFKNNSYVTPIHSLNFKVNDNNFYMKRDDLLPFSFGGNKVRIAESYFKDMFAKNCDCMITYGNSRSNLSRVIANLSLAYDVPCFVISPIEYTDEPQQTYNSKLVKSLKANIVTCKKNQVASTIQKVIDDCKRDGLKPYYVYGDIYGKGNTNPAVDAYAETFNEIAHYEKQKEINFDYIFLATGTGATQAGLISGNYINKNNKNIVGISIAREQMRAKKLILNYLSSYLKMSDEHLPENTVNIIDEFILNGYGHYNKAILETINEILQIDGVPLDPTYTGKAFWGMVETVKDYSIQNKNILFLHTGGLPLFFDSLNYKE
ncbi:MULTISPECIES: 1-aminocyclopropane-1-carboxylate deaminase/D-cysteine desulfhydrase [Allobacillus]|uniref:Pyridoxal-phosphate dependent enzyme n=1 Tax=Allobacillus salarius TaxID=1955272 RepID=A0A556PML9_9BACI|nr:pyridoxal-phosphate dependent enzyme [Allobacillus salarius]TSJ65640.1 pyridoxal-phosphate dependent enzyme [Allobacillus salarius]